MISPSPRLPDIHAGADTLAPRGPVADAGRRLPRIKFTCVYVFHSFPAATFLLHKTLSFHTNSLEKYRMFKN